MKKCILLFLFSYLYLEASGNTLDLGIANANLTTESGISCGGWALFAQICADKDCGNSCEEQIIEDPTKGFSGGTTILAKLKYCSDFISSNIEEYLFVKLTGWNDITKKSGESFCPDSFEIRFNHGVTWRSLFPSKRVTETATKALDYSGPSEIIFDDGTKLVSENKNRDKTVIQVKCDMHCSDGSCFHSSEKCDFWSDCPNGGSDEFNCPCDFPERFQCKNKHCILSSQRCDGTTDCNDRSDEEGCRCDDANQFHCLQSGECIQSDKKCDGRTDCVDGSDETAENCSDGDRQKRPTDGSVVPSGKSSCWPDKKKCGSGECIFPDLLCDGHKDCEDGSDEVHCGLFH